MGTIANSISVKEKRKRKYRINRVLNTSIKGEQKHKKCCLTELYLCQTNKAQLCS